MIKTKWYLDVKHGHCYISVWTPWFFKKNLSNGTINQCGTLTEASFLAHWDKNKPYLLAQVSYKSFDFAVKTYSFKDSVLKLNFDFLNIENSISNKSTIFFPITFSKRFSK